MFGVFELLCVQQKHTPHKTAIVHEHKRVSYQELYQRVNRLAYGLQEIGVKKGSRFGFLFYNGLQFVELFYALLKLGAIAIPFNFRLRPTEIQELILNVDCEFFAYTDAFGELVKEIKKKLTTRGIIYVSELSEHNFESNTLEALADNPMNEWDTTEKAQPDEDALLIFTGGTTGFPKAAVHTHRGLFFQVISCVLVKDMCNSEDVFLNYTPFFHVGGLGLLMMCLGVGGTFVIMSNFDPIVILDTIRQEKVTQMALIPPNICNAFEQIEGFLPEDVSSVRLIHMSGGINTPELGKKIFKLFPNAVIRNGYGMSERAALICIFITKEQFEKKPALLEAVGKPTVFTDIKLLDDNGTETDCGELWAKNAGMMKGYYGHDNSFVDGWFATGDIMRRDHDGNYYFLDRKKDMIKSGGENIYSIEVEHAIMQHPAVEICAVLVCQTNYMARQWLPLLNCDRIKR